MLHNINNNKVKIDETFYDNRILNKEYDFVIDLNKDFNFDISLLINKLNSIYKIGIKNNYSDYFYNIQFNLTSEDILEKIYSKIYKKSSIIYVRLAGRFDRLQRELSLRIKQ